MAYVLFLEFYLKYCLLISYNSSCVILQTFSVLSVSPFSINFYDFRFLLCNLFAHMESFALFMKIQYQSLDFGFYSSFFEYFFRKNTCCLSNPIKRIYCIKIKKEILRFRPIFVILSFYG